MGETDVVAATGEEIANWKSGLSALHVRIAPHLVRHEACARVGRYLDGVLSRVEWNHGWQVTEEGLERAKNEVGWTSTRLGAYARHERRQDDCIDPR